MMDHLRSGPGGGEDAGGIPDDLRCKRSDGKQWRCTAMSMPDKTVCEKHYYQAKKRAANSAMRATVKKTKRGPVGESDIYLESKSDDMDLPLSQQFGENSGSGGHGKKKKDKLSKGQLNYSPEMTSVKSFPAQTSLRSSDEVEEDASDYEETRMAYTIPPTSTVDSSRGRSEKMSEASPMMDTSDESSEASDDIGGLSCHQCRRRNVSDKIVWCPKCSKRGYCLNCISTWYSDIPTEEILSACPACRGTCSCRVCLRADNLIKARIREIPAQDKLQYLYCLLSAVLPIVKSIHSEQCSEVELEKKLRGNEIDLARYKLNADEQMCCDFCRIPIIDYHRHCTNCSYDLCLSCCKDIRVASEPYVNEDTKPVHDNEEEATVSKHIKLSGVQLNSFRKLTNWKANGDGSIPCPRKEYGGCNSSLLTLRRIFKMNWVAKLVKNVEEMVNGCNICDFGNPEKTGFDLRLCQASNRENDNENFLYNPSPQDVKNDGIGIFRMHWGRGRPVIIKEICDASAMAIWDPMAIWREIKEMTDEKMKDGNRVVKAVDCGDWSEITITLEEFMKGYFEGRVSEKGEVQLLKLKDWPAPSISEEFLVYQRPDFVSRIPLLEFIHYKWGLLNIAAKLPHFSLQNDVGPKIYFSYGSPEETGHCNSTNNLHLNVRDMVFLLVHISEVKLPGMQRTNVELQKDLDKSEANKLSEIHSNNGVLPELSSDVDNGFEANHLKDQEKMHNQEIPESCAAENKVDNESDKTDAGKILEPAGAGALWDVFRRQDIPKLVEYISIHCKDFRKADDTVNDYVSRPLYDSMIYLNRHHKSKLKEEYGVEPWSFEQHVGEAIFIPAGCPYQVRHLQSSVQLGLDFLSPESLSEAVKLSEEIRGLPNDHDVKLQTLEVGKISLYTASSAIREVRKLVLDPKMGPELGYEDPNLTGLVSQNLEKMVKRKPISCS